MSHLNNIIQHYNKEDEKYVKNIFHLMEMVERNISCYDIGFVNPYQEQIIDDLIKHFNLQKVKYLNQNFERQFISLKSIENFDTNIDDQKVSYVSITYNQKFQTIKHNQVMGALYNLGINEHKIGDIIVSESGQCQFICSHDIVDSIILLMNKVGNISIKLEIIDAISIDNKALFNNVRSSKSLRLDTVLKNLCQISRNESNKKISKKEVQVNYKTETNNKTEIQNNDLISIKGFGRIIIQDIIFNNRNYNIHYQTTKHK